MTNKLLILGKIPPPVGGVTIHVRRLLDNLENKKVDFKFLELKIVKLFLLPFYLFRYKVLHLHTSSVIVQQYISILCKLTDTICMITFHGDLNRYDEDLFVKVKKIIARIDIPIVLNDNSYLLANHWNKRSIQLSAFIPPVEYAMLNREIVATINMLKKNYTKLFVTNAYALTYDKMNNEIYGIFDLITYFNEKSDVALLVSDASGQYAAYVNEKGIKLENNITIITKPHAFYEVLKYADANIRNTSTDGDSISLKESLYLNVTTFATDVVSRPAGTITYTRGNYCFDLDNPDVDVDKSKLSDINKLVEIYRELLK